jgi:hypothetical protein
MFSPIELESYKRILVQINKNKAGQRSKTGKIETFSRHIHMCMIAYVLWLVQPLQLKKTTGSSIGENILLSEK